MNYDLINTKKLIAKIFKAHYYIKIRDKKSPPALKLWRAKVELVGLIKLIRVGRLTNPLAWRFENANG